MSHHETGPPSGGLLLLLTAQSLVVVLVSINRLAPFTLTTLPPYGFFRLVEVNNLVLALLSLAVSYLLITHLGGGTPHGAGPAGLARGLAFLVGAYLLAVSYGDHEITNYLNARFCQNDAGDLCEIVRFHDDEVSHLLFFAGFTIVNLCVIAAQWAHPSRGGWRRRDRILVGLNALFVAAGIVANLAFETIGLDLYVVAAVAIAAVTTVLRRPGQPILYYYAVAYPVGLLGTLVVKVVDT